MALGAVGVAAFASRASAGPVLSEPAGATSAWASDAELDAELAAQSITPPELNLLSLPTVEAAGVDPLASPQAELPPVIPLPPAVVPGLVLLGVVVASTRKRLASRTLR